MFGEAASAHISFVSSEAASDLVDNNTKIVANRVSRERLARAMLPGASAKISRYATRRRGVNAIQLHFRGLRVPGDGQMPTGGMVTYYLTEADECQQAESA